MLYSVPDLLGFVRRSFSKGGCKSNEKQRGGKDCLAEVSAAI
jgi:hypothetical protein